MRVLLCGVPGSGKSSFMRYLARAHGVFCLSLNGEDPPDRHDKRRAELYRAFHNDFPLVDRFLKKLRCLPQSSVVVEWGFPVNDAALAAAVSLRQSLTPIWFECPDDLARQRFVRRGTVSVTAFDRQIADIREKYDSIMEALSPIVVKVVEEDGSDRPPEALYSQVPR